MYCLPWSWCAVARTVKTKPRIEDTCFGYETKTGVVRFLVFLQYLRSAHQKKALADTS